MRYQLTVFFNCGISHVTRYSIQNDAWDDYDAATITDGVRLVQLVDIGRGLTMATDRIEE